ncbi:uncharacterized protein JCM6883_005731 [Sporobolomyces salmoneus]|uniref:uncharacterized protein n=1 Tax=Sporobolomyces salmoneus TaxID=183962 RepID=UPI00317F6691
MAANRPQRKRQPPKNHSAYEASLSPLPLPRAASTTHSTGSSPLTEVSSDQSPPPPPPPVPKGKNTRRKSSPITTRNSTSRQTTATVPETNALPALPLPPPPSSAADEPVALTSKAKEEASNLAGTLFPETIPPLPSTSASTSAPSPTKSKPKTTTTKKPARGKRVITSSSPSPENEIENSASNEPQSDSTPSTTIDQLSIPPPPTPLSGPSLLAQLPELPPSASTSTSQTGEKRSNPNLKDSTETSRKKPRTSVSANINGSGANTPATTVAGGGTPAGIAGMKIKLIRTGNNTPQTSSQTPGQSQGQKGKDKSGDTTMTTEEGGGPGGNGNGNGKKMKETTSAPSFRLGAFLSKKQPIPKKPVQPPAPPPASAVPSPGSDSNKPLQPEEPEMSYEEKLRLMKRRREEEKLARLAAEEEAIDLYEQVGWMNRYETEVRNRLNARLQACLDRNNEKSERGEEEEAILPRMNQFGSCF